MLLSMALFLYGQALRAYPRRFRATFEEEMRAVFIQAAAQALRQGMLPFLRVCLREWVNLPLALLDAHRFSRRVPKQQGEGSTLTHADVTDLAPASSTPDGRVSWTQALLEISLLFVSGVLLILGTYWLVPNATHPQQDLEMIVSVMVLVSLCVFIAGLARGLPRWAYPSGGLLLGYGYLVAARYHLAPFLGATGLAFLLLLVGAATINARCRPLPPELQRMGRSLWSDWSRLSFGVYGIMPLAINLAFDDTHANDRTPYLALAVAITALGALVHCRSRKRAVQMAALLAGASLSLGMAVLDQAYFRGGLLAWVTTSSDWLEGAGWVAGLWVNIVILLLAPILIGLARRVTAPAAPT